MATIRAFRATRYARVIPEVVAPPYDVISPEQRAELVNQSPYNIVQLTRCLKTASRAISARTRF